MERQSTIADSTIRLVYSDILSRESIDGLDEEIGEFTSATGREKGWTPVSVDDWIAACGETLGRSVLDSLHWCRFLIYRHSSEILHGTLLGALFFWGITSPPQPRSQQDFAENMGQHHAAILLAAIVAISAVVEAFHSRHGFEHAYQVARTFFKEVKSIPMFHAESTAST